jgi:hypothetical protein
LNLEVIAARVRLDEQLASHVGSGAHEVFVGHGEGDLVELHPLELQGADALRLADPALHGGDRDVNVIVEVVAIHRSGRGVPAGLSVENADHPISPQPQQDVLAERVLVAEQLLSRPGRQHGHVGGSRHVGGRKKPAAPQGKPLDIEQRGRGAEHAGVLDPPLAVLGVLPGQGERRRLLQPGERGPEAVEIAIGEAVLDDLRGLGGTPPLTRSRRPAA